MIEHSLPKKLVDFGEGSNFFGKLVDLDFQGLYTPEKLRFGT